MKKQFFILILFILFSCQQKNRIRHSFTSEKSLNSIVDFEISNLNKDENNNLYYVIQVKDLLYIIKTNMDNLLSFMLNTKIIGCYDNPKYKVSYFESKEPIFDISRMYNVRNSECDIILSYTASKNHVKNIEGIIFKIENKSMILFKKGDISKEVLHNNYFKTNYIKIQEPH